ncbi:hypothetical protein B0H10DRAFT_2111190 [Mycena sp. CBHHK59/15]|nr:hypothetical protein B0H10DRAFT_2111190 [Mycena sp. CBHHK59/15]
MKLSWSMVRSFGSLASALTAGFFAHSSFSRPPSSPASQKELRVPLTRRAAIIVISNVLSLSPVHPSDSEEPTAMVSFRTR